jgi:DNA-directed RNA polymerase I, II, and III subunit RPABC1
VKKTQLEMIRDRGFDIEGKISGSGGDAAVLSYTPEQFKNVYTQLASQTGQTIRSILSRYYQKENGSHIYVCYPETAEGVKGIGVAQFREILIYLTSYPGIKNVIVISELPLNPDIKDRLDEFSLSIEIFLYSELIVNPTKYFLVPKHYLLSPQQAKDYLRRNKIKLVALQSISLKDPQIRYLGGKIGDIVRVERFNIGYVEIVNTLPTHRVVLDIPLVEIKGKKKTT